MDKEPYKKMYAILCGAVSDAIDLLQPLPNSEEVRHLLQEALWQVEELYIAFQDIV